MSAPNSKAKPASKPAKGPKAKKDAPAVEEVAQDAAADEQVKDKAAPRKRSAGPANAHPKYIDMLVECIEEAGEKNGVSRQALKKFLQDNYGIADDSRSNKLISAAIKKGVDAGTFVLPRGASGAVKLGSGKENEDVEAKPKGTTARTKALAAKHAEEAKGANKKKPAAKKAAPKAAPKKEEKEPVKKTATRAVKEKATKAADEEPEEAAAAPAKPAGRKPPTSRGNKEPAKETKKAAPKKAPAKAPASKVKEAPASKKAPAKAPASKGKAAPASKDAPARRSGRKSNA